MHAPVNPPISIDTLMLAYRNGIFPMSDGRDDEDVFWVEPRERAILPLDGFKCSRSLRKVIKSETFTVTCNKDFERVIEACAAPRLDHPESWISRPIIASYRALHTLGHVHSVECWQEERLVGGLYGVGFDSVFCGESMFSLADNASKVALAWLVAALRKGGYRLIDCQFMTDHLASLGAISIGQTDYLQLLISAREVQSPSLPECFESLLDDARNQELTPGKSIAQSFTQTS